jgi:hypothetical protein
MPKKKPLLSIPKPAAPFKRKEALPWYKPKPIEEDPNIAKKLEAILDNSCHVPAIVDIDFLVAEGVIDAEDRDLFWYAETAEDIWLSINKWYADKGESLLPKPGIPMDI